MTTASRFHVVKGYDGHTKRTIYEICERINSGTDDEPRWIYEAPMGLPSFMNHRWACRIADALNDQEEAP